jgi:hypothetical protein
MKLSTRTGSTWTERLKQLMDEGMLEDLVLDDKTFEARVC